MHTTGREAVIIGAGAGGCTAALALAENGWKVRLFEKNKLLSGTSCMTPGRMGLGFHYMDIPTAEMLLRTTIRFVRTLPGLRIGETLPWSHPLRHGRYFITKDSLSSPAALLVVYEHLKQVYTEMVKEDPSTMVFGPPEDFYRILDQEEYENDVDMSSVVLGIETAESLLNWKEFERHLAQRITSNEKITLEEDSELVCAERLVKMQHRFMLSFVCGKKQRTVCCDYVVNSTWYEIQRINELAGFPQDAVLRTNRLKVLLHVLLPNSMLNSHSMFFCIGPFCMFSNLGDGTALITYAPVTNIEMSTDVAITKNMSRLLNLGPSDTERLLLSEGILRGAKSFIPELEHAKILELRFGIVQTHGTVDLDDVDSPVHKRASFRVRSEGAGWISNPCMKLMYLLENGDITTDILEKQFNKDNGI